MNFSNIKVYKSINIYVNMKKIDTPQKEYRINGKGMKEHGIRIARKNSSLMKRLANL